MSYRQINSSRFYVQEELVHSPAENFQTPVNKLNNINVNYLKIPQTASRAAQHALAGHMRAACLRPPV